MFTTYLPLLLPFLTLVSAHGYVSEVLINSKSYKANPVGQTSKDSVIRSVTSQDPMYGADNNGLACGPGSKPAKSMASINPGDEISFAWNGADGSHVRLLSSLLNAHILRYSCSGRTKWDL